MSVAVLQERALILAGGLGTRLRSLLPDRPKVLAPIARRPFLDILVDQLLARGFRRLVLLLGSRADQVVAHVESRRLTWPSDLEIEFSVETSPLGTGGALKLAGRFCQDRFVLMNGDTYFDLDVAALYRAHERTQAVLTIAAAAVDDAGRYGRLDISTDGLVGRFCEKQAFSGPGLINAGVYLMTPEVLDRIPTERAVSLECDVFPSLLAERQIIAASAQHGAFFDIGTPSSYESFVAFCRQQDFLRGSERDEHDGH